MNMLERQSHVAREVTQINIDAMRALMKLSADGLSRLVALNEDYLRRMAQPEGVRGFVSLQQTYGRTLLSGLSADIKARAEVVREALEQTQTAVRDGWSGSGERHRNGLAGTDTNAAGQTEQTVPPVSNAVDQAAETARALISQHVEPAVDLDNLQQIDGIGGVFAEELRSAGVLTLVQLAAIRIDDLASEAHPLHALKGRMRSEDWVEQAQAILRAGPLS